MANRPVYAKASVYALGALRRTGRQERCRARALTRKKKKEREKMKIGQKKLALFFLIGFMFFIQNLYCTLSFSNKTAIINLQDSSSDFIIGPSSLNLNASFKNGFSILAGQSIVFNSRIPVSGLLDLSGTLSLNSDLYLDSGLTYSGIGKIAGNGYALHLGGNLTIPNSNFFHIYTDTIIEGHGNSINLSDYAEILVDDNVTLTLRNIVVNSSKNGVGNPAIKLTSNRSKLALDNAVLNMANDFYVDRGQLFIHNDASFTGTNALVYRSCVPSFIASKSTLNFDLGTTFSMCPSTFTNCPYSTFPTTTTNNFTIMKDQSSQLYLNGCSLFTTPTGYRITKGTLLLDNKINIKTKATNSASSNPFTLITSAVASGADVCTTEWSPDGKYILAIAYYGNKFQILYFDGSNLIDKTGGGISVGNPVFGSWSSDGKYITFGTTNASNAHIYSIRNGFPTLVTSFTAAYANPTSAKWSPDGKYIGLACQSGTGVQVSSFNGASVTSAASMSSSTNSYFLNWSPDGKFFAVGSSGGTSTLQVYSFTPPSTLSQVSSTTLGSNVYSLQWSPDGRFIALIRIDTDNLLQIYSFKGRGAPLLVGSINTGVSSNPLGFSWTPDGKYLIVCFAGTTNNIRMYSFTGNGNPTLVGQTSLAAGGIGINVSPDGKYLCVGGLSSANLYVYRINYNNTTEVQTLSNSVVFGNSALGASYDLNVRGLSEAQIEIDGLLNYDNVS